MAVHRFGAALESTDLTDTSKPAEPLPSEAGPPAGALKGPAIMMGSAMGFATLDGLIKVIGPAFSAWDIGFYRFFLGLIIVWLLFFRKKTPFVKSRLMILRGITGSAAFMCVVAGIRLCPLSTAMVLFFSFPAFSALFAVLIFKEPFAPVEGIALVMALLGIAVTFNPHLSEFALGQILTIFGAVFAGLTICIIRRLRASFGSARIYFYFCLVGSTITAPAFFADPAVPVTLADGLILAGIVGVSVLAQIMMNQGFFYCKSVQGGVILTSEVAFTSIFGLLFLGEEGGFRFFTGAILIITSAVLLSLKTPSAATHRGAPSDG